MGGAVAVVLAHRHPDRVERLVLVDGGLTLPPPPGVPPEQMLEATIGPAAERLSMTFASREAYRDFWRAHPGLGPAWNDLVEAYVDYDLAGEPPAMRSRTEYEAVRADSIDMHTGSDHPKALDALTHPAVFLRAERGLLDEPEALFSQEQLEAEMARHPNLTGRTIPGTNHYTIAMTDPGVSAVAAEC
jgi:pimeloyl-ACP methyl ester carboxylesterase